MTIQKLWKKTNSGFTPCVIVYNTREKKSGSSTPSHYQALIAIAGQFCASGLSVEVKCPTVRKCCHIKFPLIWDETGQIPGILPGGGDDRSWNWLVGYYEGSVPGNIFISMSKVEAKNIPAVSSIWIDSGVSTQL